MKPTLIGLILAGCQVGFPSRAEDTNRFLTFSPTAYSTASSSYSPTMFQAIVDRAKTAPESRPAAEDPEGHWGAVKEGFQLSIRFQRDPWLFTADEITNLDSLGAKLCNPAAQDGVSQFLRTNLSSLSLAALAAYQGGSDPNLAQALVDDFNRIIRGGSIYDPKRFAGTNLSWRTQQDLLGSGTLELNRALLQDAYPTEFGRSQNFARETFKVGEPVWAMVLIRNATQVSVVYPVISAGWLDSDICQFNVLNEQQQPVERLGSTNVMGPMSASGRELLPSTQRKYIVLISDRFDLHTPGHYTIQATTQLPATGGGVAVLESGIAPLTIVP